MSVAKKVAIGLRTHFEELVKQNDLKPGLPVGRSTAASNNSRIHVINALLQQSRKMLILNDDEVCGMHSPLRSWVRGYVVMNNSPSAQFQDHEHIKDAETGRDRDEEVTRHDHLGMVLDESQPTLFWIRSAHWAAPAQVLLHSTGQHSNPELELQLVGNALLTPDRILGGHLSDQFPQRTTRNEQPNCVLLRLTVSTPEIAWPRPTSSEWGFIRSLRAIQELAKESRN